MKTDVIGDGCCGANVGSTLDKKAYHLHSVHRTGSVRRGARLAGSANCPGCDAPEQRTELNRLYERAGVARTKRRCRGERQEIKQDWDFGFRAILRNFAG